MYFRDLLNISIFETLVTSVRYNAIIYEVALLSYLEMDSSYQVKIQNETFYTNFYCNSIV